MEQMHGFGKRMAVAFVGGRKKRRTGKRVRGGRMMESLDNRLLFSTFCVAVNGVDAAGRGGSKSPFKSIQYAVNQAANGDTVAVAGGMYGYTASADSFTSYQGSTDSYVSRFGTTAVVVVTAKQITIKGGYSTADSFQSRDASGRATIIDGGNQYRGVLCESYGNQPTSLTLDGFTIQNGLASATPSSTDLNRVYAFGGGIYVQMSGYQANASFPFVFSNLTIKRNVAKGADVLGANPAYQFGGHGLGGGMDLEYAKNVTLSRVVFDSNKAQGALGTVRGGGGVGGAIHMGFSTVTGSDVEFLNNSAIAGAGTGGGHTSDDQTADGLGGGIAIQSEGIESSLTLTRVLAINNLAAGGNAGSATGNEAGSGFGGFIFGEKKQGTTSPVTITITDLDARNNAVTGATGYQGGQAGGGVIETANCVVNINRAVMIGNTVVTGSTSGGTNGTAGPGGGGAVYLTKFDTTAAATSSITNAVIAGNSVKIGTASNNKGGGGGGVWLQGIATTLDHLTIADNSIDAVLYFGAAVIALGENGQAGATVSLTNSIVSGNSGPLGSSLFRSQDMSVITLGKNLVVGNSVFTQQTTGLGGSIVGTSNLVTSGQTGYVGGGSPGFDYRLTGASSAADLGTDVTGSQDAGGFTRTNTPDAGAFELGSAVVKTLSVSDVDATVKGSDVVFTVSLGRASASDVVVNYATANGNGLAGVDYTAKSGQLTIPAGQLFGTISVPTLATGAGGTSFTLGITPPVGFGATQAVATAAILAEGVVTPPSLSVSASTVGRPAVGATGSVVFTFTLSEAAVADVSVNYATADGTATAPADYAAATGTLVIAKGQQTGTLTVPIQRGNGSAASFVLNLSGVAKATLDTTSVTANLTAAFSRTLSLTKGVASYTDAAGKKVTVKLAGTGSVVLSFLTNGKADAASLSIRGTNSKSIVTIDSNGSVVKIGQISVSGTGLASLVAPKVELSGAFDASSAAVGIIGLRALKNGTLNLKGGNTNIGISSVTNASIYSTSAIKNVVVGSWSDPDGGDTISGTSISTVTAGGNLPVAVVALTGNIGTVTVAKTLNGSLKATRGTIKEVIVGAMSGATVDGKNITTVTVGKGGGTIRSTVIHAGVKFGTLVAGTLQSSRLLAGLPVTQTTLPTALTDFASGSSVGTVTLKKFKASIVAAKSIDSLALGAVTAASGPAAEGAVSGLLKKVTASFSGNKSFSKTKLDAPQTFGTGDFVIQSL